MSSFATISSFELGTVVGGASSKPAPSAGASPAQPENIGNDAITGALSGLANSFGSSGSSGSGSSGGFNGNAIFQDLLGGLLGTAQGALGGLAKKTGAAK